MPSSKVWPDRDSKRRDPLWDHVVVFHELLPGTFRQPEAKVALALLQAHELRYVRGRKPHRASGRQDRE